MYDGCVSMRRVVFSVCVDFCTAGQDQPFAAK